MKKLLIVAVMGMLGASVIGCRASAEVDDVDSADSSRSYKKTEYKSDGGTKTTKTEVKRETSY
jgi:hypothetical protein